ncbi:MAG: SUMF1/EgtB/PvdO family nonheme iron enzyme [Thermodesulfobacteriota bacterium]
MAFDLTIWKKLAAEKLRDASDWAKRFAGEKVPYAVYGTVGGLTLWPAIEAAKSGELLYVGGALAMAAAGVGGNLVAQQIQRWVDRKSGVDEAEVIRWVVENTANKDILAELDAILKKVESVEQANAQIRQSDRQWFVKTLEQEMQRLGNLSQFKAVLIGSGAIVQGKGAKGLGERAMLFEGPVSGSIFSTDKVAVHITQGEKKRFTEADALRKYREYVFETCQHLPMRGIDIGASDPTSGQKRMDLALIYVGLNTKTAVPGKKGKRSKQGFRVPGDEETRPLTALEAAIQNRFMVLLGDPGSGKTTFVHHLALCLAGHGLAPSNGWLDRIPGWPEKEDKLVPVPVALKDFAARMANKKKRQADPIDLWQFIVSRLAAQNLRFAKDALEAALERGEAMLLLDGLDEIQDASNQGLVRDVILAFQKRYKKARMLVTCRVLSYQEESARFEGVPFFDLAPFDEEMISAFIKAWYTELQRLEIKSHEEADGMVERLQEAVQRPDIRRLAPNPLLLTVMALVHTYKGKLPDERAMLYEDAVDMLLYRWDQLKAAGDWAQPRLTQLLDTASRAKVDLQTVLGRLAFESHGEGGFKEGEALADIKDWQLQNALAELHPAKSRDWAAQLIDTIKLRAGLLIERQRGIFTFPHRTFQEFLAGVHLSKDPDFAKHAARLAGEAAFWREVILLAVGRLVYHVGDFSKPLDLVSELCPHGKKESSVEWRKAWLAGEVLLEIGVQRAQDRSLGRDMLQRVPESLTELLSTNSLTPLERAMAGKTLAKLGDPRFDPDMWYLLKKDDLGFVEIPEGNFRMGSDKNKDPNAYDDEVPMHQVGLPTYYIGKYPVTVAQFRSFVEKSGHKSTDKDRLKGIENHPVVLVSWYDGVAYCEWLTKQFRESKNTPEWIKTLLQQKWIVRLPTEAEWEKAARGTDGRSFPWGNETDPRRANYGETGIGATSAVGCFQKGVSPYGVLDMAGNVLEWTQSLWGKDFQKPEFKYPYDPDDGRENLKAGDEVLRVLRGGAFLGDQWFVRCAYRVRLDPDNRFDFIGFRVVLAPEIPSVL